MAATSTNKQPLLIDRVLHNVVNLDTAAVGAIDISGTNTAALIVDATQSDGCIIEDVYSISRSTAPQTINLYLSPSFDYLRPIEGVFIGQLVSGTSKGAVTSMTTLPKILAPMPHIASRSVTTSNEDQTNSSTTSENQFRALYIPKGKALWAGREDIAAVNDGPLLGVQGGWY